MIEPSAGTGSLAIWPQVVGTQVIVNEISPRRRAMLGLLGFQASEVDAEFFDDLYPAEIVPSAVLMNPPFSATGGRVERNSSQFGARHFKTMLKRLALGGRLVGVAGEGMRLDKPGFTSWWQEVAKRYTVRAVVGLNGREYTKHRTSLYLIYLTNCPIKIYTRPPALASN